MSSRFSSVLWFLHKTMFDSTPICVVWGSCFIYVICIYLRTLASNMISCRLTVTQRVSHVEQELLSLPEHSCLPLVFSGVRVSWSLVFYEMFCRSLFVNFLLAIMLSVLLRFTDSDYSLVSSNWSCAILQLNNSSDIIINQLDIAS